MKWIVCFFLLFSTVSGFSDESQINWIKDYETGVQTAKKQKKPLLLFFTGSDWCPWCFKIQDEVVTDPAFINSIKDSFVFVEIDFPKRTLLPEAVSNRNKELRALFEVKTFPTMAMVDPEVGVITKMGYLEIGGEKYAQQLKNSLNDYQMIRKALHNTPEEWDESLEKLYEKAKHLGCEPCVQQIYDRGVEKDPGPFFLLEKYAKTIESKEIDEKRLSELRSEITTRDPDNVQGSHRRLAILDFQHKADHLNPKDDPMQVVEPLIAYIDTYGKKDKDNVWRLEMMVSQYLFSQERVAQALKHARRSYKVAPQAVRKEISESIVYLKEQLVSAS